MFASAEAILSKYIDTSGVSRFTFYSVEMERGENIEDLYYLCSTRDGYYVVFETDYVLGTLADIATEATEIFKAYNLTPLHWVVKKDAQKVVGTSSIPVDASNLEEYRKDLFSDGSAWPYSYAVRYAVIEFASTKETPNRRRSNPAVYGNTL